jgi:glycosyltransferase involved in cell wall biosynthesis
MVIDSLRLGGAERVLATLSAVAPAARFEFEVLVLSPPDRRRSVMEPVLRDAGVAVRYLSLRRLADPRALPRLVRAIRSSGCDVVHAHLEDAITLAPLSARMAGVPAVCSFHHVAVPVSRREAVKERLAVMAANASAGVIFVSRASMESFARTYGGRRPNWSVIENGVDLDHFSPGLDPMPEDLCIPAGVPVVTMIAALRRRKGHTVALAAWRAVRERFPDARLLIVGEGPVRTHLGELASELQIADSVVFAGTRTEAAHLMRASTLLALPSEHEALPTTLMEAAACGRAVVSTNVDGIPEVVVDGETGLLIPVGDPRALAAALIELLGDEPRRRAMGERARVLAEQRFDARHWGCRLQETYAGARDAQERSAACV